MQHKSEQRSTPLSAKTVAGETLLLKAAGPPISSGQKPRKLEPRGGRRRRSRRREGGGVSSSRARVHTNAAGDTRDLQRPPSRFFALACAGPQWRQCDVKAQNPGRSWERERWKKRKRANRAAAARAPSGRTPSRLPPLPHPPPTWTVSLRASSNTRFLLFFFGFTRPASWKSRLELDGSWRERRTFPGCNSGKLLSVETWITVIQSCWTNSNKKETQDACSRDLLFQRIIPTNVNDGELENPSLPFRRFRKSINNFTDEESYQVRDSARISHRRKHPVTRDIEQSIQ